MKAIFKKTAYDRIMEIICNAEFNRKTIDYILVTPQEMHELHWHCTAPHYLTFDTANTDLNFETVDIKYPNDPYSHKSRRFIVSPYRISGQRIVVAPIEYHPV
jgi:hypothetical protein